MNQTDTRPFSCEPLEPTEESELSAFERGLSIGGEYAIAETRAILEGFIIGEKEAEEAKAAFLDGFNTGVKYTDTDFLYDEY